MADEYSPFTGIDLREVLRGSDEELAAAVRPPDAVIAAAIREQAVALIREGHDHWPPAIAIVPSEEPPLSIITPAFLRTFRANLHVSQGWIGQRLGGVTAQMVSKWEREDVPIPLAMQERLAVLVVRMKERRQATQEGNDDEHE